MVEREKLENRIEALTARHKALDKEITSLYSKSYSHMDDILAQMKRDKLSLKDEIENLTKQMEMLNG